MSKRGVIWRVCLLFAVIVMANLYYGCVHKHYSGPEPGAGSVKTHEQDTQIQEQDKQIEELQKELDALKKNQ